MAISKSSRKPTPKKRRNFVHIRNVGTPLFFKKILLKKSESSKRNARFFLYEILFHRLLSLGGNTFPGRGSFRCKLRVIFCSLCFRSQVRDFFYLFGSSHTSKLLFLKSKLSENGN
ncbi:hypothetical protein A0128_15885 [Leptospira tipperaryensis]|uniref:Uncharacterized protein n=1 Tax=Leptospira tipperaryensis TaxID=2564040 RepID=A0A1D7V048_9LEPT|nr:hypothetical protein A0128_15885 [Leptospira tipperaryensis]